MLTIRIFAPLFELFEWVLTGKKKTNTIISKFPFFYGYVIIFAGTIGVIMSAPGQTVGISVFTDFLIEDLKISRDNLSLAYLIGTLLSSLILTYAGKFYDKFPAVKHIPLSAFFSFNELYRFLIIRSPTVVADLIKTK